MAIINKGTAFSNGEQLSANKLNDLVDGATFGTDSVDNASTIVNANGAITVRDSGVTAAKLATGAVTASKIVDDNVTFAKLTDVIDDDTMATATDSTLATSESIKAYVDSLQTRSKFITLTGGTLALDSGNQSAGTSTYNIADFTSNDVDFTTSSITAIVIFGYAGSDLEVEAFVKATLPDGQETDIAYLKTFGTNTNKGRQGSSFYLPINEGQSSFNIRYSGGAECRSVILGAIIN